MSDTSNLVSRSQRFAKEDVGRTWRLLLGTVAVQAALLGYIAFIPFWWAKLPASILAGLVIVRLFIFFHDFNHGAIFRRSTLGRWAMYPIGLYTLSAPAVWKETHDYHHKNNARMLGSAIGSYPIVTLGIWKGMTPAQRVLYRFIRHPVTIALGWLTMFMLGMCLAPFKRSPREHWTSLLTLVLYAAITAAAVLSVGWLLTLFLIVIPGLVSSAAGAYLFYAQHNFPGMEMRGRRDWDFVHAALKCSSMFDMSKPMHWFTGNIGYHHVHHLNHKIPFYRLPEAYAALPELQECHRTSWALRDVWGCLSLELWDADQKRMLTHREARRVLHGGQAVAAK